MKKQIRTLKIQKAPTKQTMVYTIVYAVEHAAILNGEVNIREKLDNLREMGMAEVVEGKLVDKPFEAVTVNDAAGLIKPVMRFMDKF